MPLPYKKIAVTRHGVTTVKFYDRQDRLHRDGKPAYMMIQEDGSTMLVYYQHGRISRPPKNGVDQPALIDIVKVNPGSLSKASVRLTYYNEGREYRSRGTAAGMLPYDVYICEDGYYSLSYNHGLLVFGDASIKTLQVGADRLRTYKFDRSRNLTYALYGDDQERYQITPERATDEIEVPKIHKLTEMPYMAIRPS